MHHQNNTPLTTPLQNGRAIDIVWPLLLILTVMSYLLAEKSNFSAFSTPLILGIAGLKALFIGLVFMEIRHTVWWMQSLFILFFCGLSAGLIICLKL